MDEISTVRPIPLPARKRDFSFLRSRNFWIAAGAVVLLLAALAYWSVGAYRRAQSRDVLNEFAAFQNPALELTFPRITASSDSARQVLAAGVREGVWGVSERGGRPGSLEVWLTVQGQKWFSIVGNKLVATFKTGRREVTKVLEVEQDFPGRRVRFRYAWRELHPGSGVLGAGTPELGREYNAEALFLYEGDHWRVMHWTTPEYDSAVAQFATLTTP